MPPPFSRVLRSLIWGRQQPNLLRCVWQTKASRNLQTPRPSPQVLASPPAHSVDWIRQPWHEFRSSLVGHRWASVGTECSRPTTKRTPSQDCQSPRSSESQSLTLVTWNVNAASLRPRARIAALLSHVLGLIPAADVIFLQEVSRLALSVIMEDPRIRADWFSTDMDSTHWGRQPFANVTLLSKARFHQHPDHALNKSCLTLGRVWRIKYQSRYDRDALCCDIHVVPPPSSKGGSQAGGACIRLINVHLDSLAIRPSHRPGQIATVASALRDAGRGLVAGDFNPVLPEDQTLVADNGLVDAWTEAACGRPCGRKCGNTWGTDRGKRCASSRRLDKVAMMNLDVEAIDILRPGVISSHPMGWKDSDKQPNGDSIQPVVQVPWSDHSGIRCTFSWARKSS